MRKLVYILFALIALFFGYFLFVSPRGEQAAEPISAGGVIVCFGDSLTYGTGASPGMDYPSRLAGRLNREVVNAGVPGDTTASALKRLQRDVLSETPALVLITLGGNDLKNGVPADEALANLIEIVEVLQKSGARVIVGGLRFPMRDRGYGKAYAELAERTGVVLIPNVLDGILGNRNLMSDPIHPNDDGYELMAGRFYEAVLDIR
jgi:lysophospholipase L1-like esterase